MAQIITLNTPSGAATSASAPGTGAQRAIGITQLYVRLASCDPLAVVVAEALSLTFGASGATRQELSSYLSLSEGAVQAGLDGVPGEMLCTSAELEDEGRVSAHTPMVQTTPENDGDYHSGGSLSEERRFYVNYKRTLSVAYAHMSQILLALCLSPLPASPYTERVRRTQLGAAARSLGGSLQVGVGLPDGNSSSGGREGRPGATTSLTLRGDEDLAMSTLRISPTLLKREALEGIYCLGCQFYFALQDFAGTVSRCPTCGRDVLRLLVEAVRERLNAQYVDRGRSLLARPPPRPTSAHPGARVPTHRPTPSAAPPPAKPVPASVQGLDCPLMRDPFLVQQALAFLYLYSSSFACLNDARAVVDPNDIVTEPEYERRLRGRASLADEFRALHRNPKTVRVKLVSQRQLDERIRSENVKKLAKRSQLPPWLRPRVIASPSSKPPDHTRADHSLTGRGSALGSKNGTGKEEVGEDASKTLPRTEAAATGSERKRRRDGAEEETPAAREARLLHAANFVATEFLEDDFDAVALPRYDTL